MKAHRGRLNEAFIASIFAVELVYRYQIQQQEKKCESSDELEGWKCFVVGFLNFSSAAELVV